MTPEEEREIWMRNNGNQIADWLMILGLIGIALIVCGVGAFMLGA